MKRNRKLEECLNCGNVLTKEENFCPDCGQQNRDQKVPVGVFVQDFFSNYLSFDTSFFRTARPFIFSPGKLTLEFNAGKRNYYIHPIRLYLISSLFYFFVIGIIVPANSLDLLMNGLSSNGSFSILGSNKEAASVPEKDKESLEKVLSDNQVAGLLTGSSSNVALQKSDSLETLIKWSHLKAAALDTEMSDEDFNQLLSRYPYKMSAFDVQKQRAMIANSNLFLTNAVRNLPLMMFLLLPVFALFLMLLQRKNKKYYIEHLIHGLHLHSFAYFFYGFGIILLFNFSNIEETILLTCFGCVSLYAFLSVWNVYKNDLFKAFLKFSILGFFYFSLLIVALASELYISLLLL